jgi:hypothetical protein
MSTKLAYPIVPTTEACPNCKCRMTITEITPVLFSDDLEDVAYRCKRCLSEMKRTYRRCSGTWQLIHYTPAIPSDQGDPQSRKRWRTEERPVDPSAPFRSASCSTRVARHSGKREANHGKQKIPSI